MYDMRHDVLVKDLRGRQGTVESYNCNDIYSAQTTVRLTGPEKRCVYIGYVSGTTWMQAILKYSQCLLSTDNLILFHVDL